MHFSTNSQDLFRTFCEFRILCASSTAYISFTLRNLLKLLGNFLMTRETRSWSTGIRLFLPVMAWSLTSLWFIISSESIIPSERKNRRLFHHWSVIQDFRGWFVALLQSCHSLLRLLYGSSLMVGKRYYTLSLLSFHLFCQCYIFS